jgi:hypothetical protein
MAMLEFPLLDIQGDSKVNGKFLMTGIMASVFSAPMTCIRRRLCLTPGALDAVCAVSSVHTE